MCNGQLAFKIVCRRTQGMLCTPIVRARGNTNTPVILLFIFNIMKQDSSGAKQVFIQILFNFMKRISTFYKIYKFLEPVAFNLQNIIKFKKNNLL